LDYSKYYWYLWEGQHPNQNISQRLLNLRKIEAKSVTPYIISLLEDFQSGEISYEIVVSAIDLIESYIVRGSICEIPSSSLPKTFASLHREVKRIGDNWQKKYNQYLMYVLGRKVNKGRFPKDAEVKQAISERDFYQFNNTIRNYIFDSLENKKKKDRTNIQEGLLKCELSIEHIMPKTLSKK